MPEYHMDLPKEDIDAVLRTKRKAREPKACYPCHSRKVKCDRKLPCDSCIKRDHADLCTYERPLKRQQIALANGPVSDDGGGSRSGSPTYGQGADPAITQVGDRVTMSKEKWDLVREELRTAQQVIANLQSGMGNLNIGDDQEMDHSNSNETTDDGTGGIHAQSGRMGTVHLGSRSVLAYMVGLGRSKSSQDAARTVLEENVLPKLGLDNETATYPFVDLWSTTAGAEDVNGLCSTMPDDRICRDFVASYRDVACTIYPVVYDTKALEQQMELMLQNRARAGGVYVPAVNGPERPYGVSISWLGLFFAVMASGSQSSNLPAKERELTSQVYVCCAYQALRMTNFMSYPSIEAIQTLLIICNVLAYNMNPGNAYVVLGMALRLAYSLGLHMDSESFSPAEAYARRRVWWALAWQDSHYSISYDRPTGTAITQPGIPYAPNSVPGNRSYGESMFGIIHLTLEIIKLRMLKTKSSMPLPMTLEYKDRVASIVADAAPHMRDRRYCVTTTQHLERLALKLHANYMTSELCRTVVKGPTKWGSSREASSPRNSPDAEVMTVLRHDLIRALSRSITAFLELHTISILGTRSWVGIQRAVSAAFLLGTMEEARADTKIHGLLQSLEEVIATRMNFENELFTSTDMNAPYSKGVRPFGPASRGNSFSSAPSTESPQWAKSMSQSLRALGKLNNVLADPKTHQEQYSMMHSSNSYGFPSDPNMSMNLGQQSSGAMLMQPKQEILLTPVTPDSSSSSDWNAGNIIERAGQFVNAPLW